MQIDLKEEDFGIKVFSRSSLRNSYFALVTDGYQSARSVQELDEMHLRHLPKLREMESGSDFDQLAAAEIIVRFRAASAHLTEEERRYVHLLTSENERHLLFKE